MDSVFPKPYDDDLQDVAEGMAIVIDGDNAPKAISNGQYLFIKNHSTLATGGYHATAAIGSGDAVSSSNVAADADGIVNAAYASLNSKIGKYRNTSAQSVANLDAIKSYISAKMSEISNYDFSAVAFECSAVASPFSAYGIYVGHIWKINGTTFSGLVTSQWGNIIKCSCDGGSWSFTSV